MAHRRRRSGLLTRPRRRNGEPTTPPGGSGGNGGGGRYGNEPPEWAERLIQAVTTGFDRMHQDLGTLVQIDSHLVQIDGRLDNMNRNIGQRFNEVLGRLGGIDQKLDQALERLPPKS